MSSSAPYRLARLSSLFLSFAFGVVGFGIGLNALVKSNDDKNRLRHSVPPGTNVNINTSDVFASGVVVTVASGLIALFSFFSFPSVLLSSRSFTSSRILSAQSAILAFLSIFLFSALIPFTDFVANRQAKVTAFIGTIPVPDAVIRSIEASLGASPIYKDIGYLKNTAILPWFAFLFGVTSATLTFLAARRTAAAAATSGFGRNLGGPTNNGYETEEKKNGEAVSQQQV